MQLVSYLTWLRRERHNEAGAGERRDKRVSHEETSTYRRLPALGEVSKTPVIPHILTNRLGNGLYVEALYASWEVG
jgi:hypothetical protein